MMASGYEKHPDYGGKPPSVASIIIILLLWIIIGTWMYQVM